MLEGHEKAVLQFSGGKDSLAALYLMRAHLDKIEVHFGDTGALFPAITEFVIDTCWRLNANLVVVRPQGTMDDYHAKFGLPSDIVPDWSSVLMRNRMTEDAPQLIQSAMQCCYNRLWAPMKRAVAESGATLVIRGTKEADERLGVRQMTYIDENGVTYISPVWHWSDQDVLDYLKAEGAEIPEQYPDVDDGMDCWLCTGHMRTHYAESRMNYIVKHHPALVPHIADRARRLKAALHDEQDKVDHVLDIAIGAGE